MENLLESFNGNPINMAIAIGAVILVVYILMKVARTVLKFVLTIAIIALAWYFWQGGTVDGLKLKGVEQVFKDTSLSNMEEDLCQGEKADKLKCQCIVMPVKEDLESRFSQEEMQRMDTDEEIVKEEIARSIKNQQKEIRSCLVKEGGGKYMNLLKGILGNNQ